MQKHVNKTNEIVSKIYEFNDRSKALETTSSIIPSSENKTEDIKINKHKVKK